MVKFINIGFVILLVFSCKKDKVPDSLGEEYQFLIGEWQWDYSKVFVSQFIDNILNNGSYNDFVYATEVSEWCSLTFSADRTLTIKSDEGIKIIKLIPQGVISIGNNKIARFSNEFGEVINISWSETLNSIETEYPFFSLTEHPYFSSNVSSCNPEFKPLISSYEKH